MKRELRAAGRQARHEARIWLWVVILGAALGLIDWFTH